ncbi:Der1 family protein, partial [Toxoplasma gondii RUB]
MAQVDLFFSHLPPVTRFYLFCSTALMLLCTLEIVSPFSLYINYNLVLQRGQVWRIFSCFLFFGTFSLHFFWNVYVLIFYCATLEEHQRSATFLWMLLTTGALLL